MKKKEPITERPCKDCKNIINYIPRRTRCYECYIKKQHQDNLNISNVNLFIPDE